MKNLFNTDSFLASDEYGDVFYFSTNQPTSLEGLDIPSHCKVVDTNTGKAIVNFASFAEAEEIAKKYNLTIHSYTKRDGERVWTDYGWEDAPFDMRKAVRRSSAQQKRLIYTLNLLISSFSISA